MTIEPATDEDLTYIKKRLIVGLPEVRNDPKSLEYVLQSLIARIKIERENTIKECASFVRPLPLADDSDIEKQAYDIRQVLFDRILSLLKAPSNQEGDK